MIPLLFVLTAVYVTAFSLVGIFCSIGARTTLIAEGIAQRPGDIDAVWVNGYGWPRGSGGIMYWAGVK